MVNSADLSVVAKATADRLVRKGLYDRITDEYILLSDDIIDSLDFDFDLEPEDEVLFEAAVVDAIKSHSLVKGLETFGGRMFLSFHEPFTPLS